MLLDYITVHVLLPRNRQFYQYPQLSVKDNTKRTGKHNRKLSGAQVGWK